MRGFFNSLQVVIVTALPLEVECARMTAPVTLFYSYSHKDEDLRDELDGHLKILERRGMVQAWHDREIVCGQSLG